MNSSAKKRDRQIEMNRYDTYAEGLGDPSTAADGLSDADPYITQPYFAYATACEIHASKQSNILEFGAGTGRFSGLLSRFSDHVYCIDISRRSLLFNRARRDTRNSVSYVVCDIAALPFGNQTMDLICSAGSLSYADPDKVKSEIRRILTLGGTLIVVDSLNQNWIYRLNRYLHYLRRQRSKSTLQRMPTVKTLNNLTQDFQDVSISYFGAATFLYPIIKFAFGSENANRILSWIDGVSPPSFAFKFVLVARDFRPTHLRNSDTK